ncbi:MAG: hypothetical protein JO307_08285, partial [Bryobacterales bacterium]|nr:hypothetical protein [Bryobacterales bacterium]
MAASESISINSNACAELTFDFYPLRFRFVADRPIHFAAGESANLLRGKFGKALLRQSPEAYRRLFAPSASSGPSGLHDPPRPFVLRAAHLDGVRVQTGEAFEIGINLFEMDQAMIDPVASAIRGAVHAPFVALKGAQPVRLSLAAASRPIRKVRVQFVTPTELKGVGQDAILRRVANPPSHADMPALREWQSRAGWQPAPRFPV